jgi:hypothetical protein
MTDVPVCVICFEDLHEANPACPVPEGHAVSVEPPKPHPNTFTWGRYMGKDVHLTCAGPEAMKVTWEIFAGLAVDADGNCEICGQPLDVLP